MSKKIILLPILFVSLSSVVACNGRGTNKDEYDKDGRLKISLRNLYFEEYNGGDAYLEELEKLFNVKVTCESYSWADWETQVNGQIMSNTIPDVFHMNIDSYNFSSYYKYWAEETVTKQLPDDLSKWPNLKKVIDNTTNIDSLKIDGHLYGIPIAKNTTDYSTTFSPFTYIYRRDWAKKWGVYKENDEYTWDEFQELLRVFTSKLDANFSALADVEWGFPSLTNFYKEVPHCFVLDDETNKYVNNYTTKEYIEGLEFSKTAKNNGWYRFPQYSMADGEASKKYYGNQCGVFYENLSYDNFVTLKKKLIASNVETKDFNLDDATAIMKIKGPDGKYALEGTDNWFSMTFFDYRMSDNKMNKILDILDWLLSEEGTTFAIYGFEDYDYVREGDEIKLIEEYWPKEKDGSYAPKKNGARYLRKLVSLGYDTQSYDPLTDKDAVNYLKSWDTQMRNALSKGDLRILKEDKDVMWLTSPMKAEWSGTLRTEALDSVKNYIYGEIKTIEKYKESVTNSTWKKVLEEINKELGK